MHRNFAFILFYVVLLNFGVINAEAQSRDTSKLRGSRSLDSITVSASSKQFSLSNRRFSPGTNSIRVSSEALAKMQMSSLAEFIQQENAVYLKEYGRGMGAYISVRGTSSSHTTIAWNGQSLSVPTMGQTDLSHIPLYFFDAMEIHIGGNSALYGDGSIGGSIQLNTKPKWEKGIHGDILLSAGSFNSFLEGATLRFSGKTTESRTSLLHSSALNNYPFTNNTSIGRPTERLNNSAFDNYGLLQEVYKKFRDSSLLTATLMYQNFDREIQPSVSSNDRPESYESIYDKNLKLNIGYNASRNHFSYGARISYAYDNQRYKEDIIAAGRYFASVDAEYRLDKLTFKGGASGEFIKPDVYSYADSVRETKVNIFALLRFVPYDRLILSGGIRYTKVTNTQVPVMPSLDAKYLLIRSANHIVALRGSMSQNSKVPSLNDRYWGGEHLYLRSECSFTTEGGADYSWFSGAWSVDLFGTLYRSSVKDWIRWLPAGVIWRPQNIPEVLSRGAEAGARLTGRISDWNLSLNFSYAYTNIRMIEAVWTEDPAVGKQLAYQPKHSWRTTIKAERGALSLYGGLYFTGERTTIDIFDILPSYLLTDVGAIYRFKVFGEAFTANGVVKNIFDVSYQNVKFYAMPGRNWQISLKWQF
ncbi:MAG: hypothetical protein A2X18_04085 [Bacteroidetes bacterium GWF2_40_14]|nr:MAG: hypothetical protein A2X18_04085 [Bacteroidetes bacterium GWF2_40_14]